MSWDGTLSLLVTEPWSDYGLVDSGGGRKLERYGPYRFIRPEPQAMWTPAAAEWEADGEFLGGSDEEGGGRWQLVPRVPPRWDLARGAVRFHAANTPFRHLGFFPDMAVQWDFMEARMGAGRSFLNVFGYTGLASLIAAAAGATVTHVDASKKAVAAAKDNAVLSGLAEAPVRWLVDDALKFLRREVRRGNRYHGLMLDPPKYGRGPDGEIWSLERDLPELVQLARQLVADDGFVILTVYAIRMSAVALAGLVAEHFAPLGGRIEVGDMAVREEVRGTLLPTAIFARWSAG
ncbi:SAM-dependent methyltransferase [Polymorphobacter multimanifer]|uniref:23S rRNA (Cytosine1962-C5)-methyltransferase n=1 Tax=Polymorphobacter multimanifer TaxID=1070431 RepID=A0A841L4T1_9SPHN|nr:class I SAM-dependent methyltransferase [Polymorphobacter multimanifer]MBB6227634.1 23S rRNA (cytosine1962-C5)-methyltransferase [Polymorphobacter multimanifer]GGI75024.1 SAM-dependent methyltransferase [Polymorphobacter multimanifer]